ncbi:tetratricopeptide repeat protein, partial [Klebsiella pneumoniae]|uniref:tetratricopeptide repeat protein n=1 Tax=Klebsiella pneumoniae TaxID=573 RepID=UPI0030132227
DHPDTLISASNLAVTLRALDEYEAAQQLNEDTLARYRRVLGEDHPHTLRTARNLTVALRNLRLHDQADAIQDLIDSTTP